MNEKTNLHLDDLRKCTQDFESAEDFHYPIIQNEYTNNLGVKTYTSGQIGKYFGVAISTISLWISEGRFFDIEKPGMGIKETTLWKAPNTGFDFGSVTSYFGIFGEHLKDLSETIIYR